MPDDGEPIGRGQIDRRAQERRALGNALLGAALFTGVVLVNGTLLILLIGLLEAIGWWEVSATGGLASLTSELPGELRRRALVD